MRKLIVSGLILMSLGANAQKNKFLEPSFWQASPDVAAVKAAIEAGNSPSEMNQNSFDPVVMAINAEAPTASVKYLLTQPGNEVSKLTHDGRIYLHWAASRGNEELVAYLLDKGSKFDVKDSHGTTPLLFAASAGQQNTKIYDLFIAHGDNIAKDVTEGGANALLLAIANDKDLTLTNYFVSKKLDINSTDAAGNNAFSYAARSGNIELLKRLLEKGVKANPDAMLMAAQGGGGRRGGSSIGLPVYQYLESLNIKATATGKGGENALHYIVSKPNQTEVIQYFLSKGVDVNQLDEEGNNVFMNAAASSRDTSVFALLAPRVKNINQANKKGQTALTLAVGTNSPDVIRYLLAKGADVKTVDKDGNNLAYYVVESFRPQMPQGRPGGQGAQGGPGERPANAPRADDLETKLAILKEKGLNLAAPQKNGNTLYHVAVAKNNLPLVKRLESLGIDVNAKNSDGITALHKAAMIAKDDLLMKYLISVGAKKDAVTNFEETAFDLATENESLTKNNIPVNFLK